MKRFRLLLLLLGLILGLGFGPATADDRPEPKHSKPQTLLDYRSELALTDQQVKTIQKTLLAYHTVVSHERKSLSSYEKEYSALVASGAPLEEIKSKLRQCTDATFNLRLADVSTARKVESVLSAAQLKTWHNLQAKVRQSGP